MFFKNYLDVYCGVFANRKYQCCMETRSVALFKEAVCSRSAFVQTCMGGFHFWESLQLSAHPAIRKSEFSLRPGLCKEEVAIPRGY